MKKTLSIVLVLVMACALLAGCTPGSSGASPNNPEPSIEPAAEPIVTTVAYPSRGVEVPATVVLPAGDGQFPLVVMCHGHGGGRDENVGFVEVANAMAKKGIATIRMDFPGCGESGESFTANIQSNMKQDVLAAIEYAKANLPIDDDEIGIFGYSMGGRIALELIAEDSYDFDAAVFLAPAADLEDLKNLFGGAEGWDSLKKAANESADGYTVFTTIYGQEQNLSKEWFDDLEKYAGTTLIDAAAKEWDEPSLVIYAVDDAAVSPSVSQAVADALSSEVVTTPEDGHSYGFYSDKVDVLNTVATSAADFFSENLK